MSRARYQMEPTVFEGGTRDYLTAAETAKLVRAALKDAFPGVKFSVTSDTYSGGASIDVHYTDGPTEKAVESVAKDFEGATFDGMIDLQSSIGPQTVKVGKIAYRVKFGADFVFVKRHLSEATKLNLAIAIEAKYGIEFAEGTVYPQIEVCGRSHMCGYELLWIAARDVDFRIAGAA